MRRPPARQATPPKSVPALRARGLPRRLLRRARLRRRSALRWAQLRPNDLVGVSSDRFASPPPGAGRAKPAWAASLCRPTDRLPDDVRLGPACLGRDAPQSGSVTLVEIDRRLHHATYGTT